MVRRIVVMTHNFFDIHILFEIYELNDSFYIHLDRNDVISFNDLFIIFRSVNCIEFVRI